MSSSYYGTSVIVLVLPDDVAEAELLVHGLLLHHIQYHILQQHPWIALVPPKYEFELPI